MRPTPKSPQGGILEKEAPIHASKVMPIDPKTGKPHARQRRQGRQGQQDPPARRAATSSSLRRRRVSHGSDERTEGQRPAEAGAEGAPQAEVVSTAEIETPRFSIKYAKEVVPALMQAVRLQEPDAGSAPREDRGQHGPRRRRGEPEDHRRRRRGDSRRSPVRSRSSPAPRKSIASFKLRAGLPIGVKVTLRARAHVGVRRSPHHDLAAARP